MIKKVIRVIGGLRVNTGFDLNLGQLFSAKRGQRLGYISLGERHLPDMVWQLLEHNPSLSIAVVTGTQTARNFAMEMLAHKTGKTVQQIKDVATAMGKIMPAWYLQVDYLIERLVASGRLSILGLNDLARNQIFKSSDFAQKGSIFSQALETCFEPANDKLTIVKDADLLFGLEKGQKSSLPTEYVEMLRNLFLSRPGYTLVNSEKIADRMGFIMAKNLVTD